VFRWVMGEDGGVGLVWFGWSEEKGGEKLGFLVYFECGKLLLGGFDRSKSISIDWM
jgi:hypothetical protein